MSDQLKEHFERKQQSCRERAQDRLKRTARDLAEFAQRLEDGDVLYAQRLDSYARDVVEAARYLQQSQDFAEAVEGMEHMAAKEEAE